MTLLTAKSRFQKGAWHSGPVAVKGEAQVGAVIAARLSTANCILSNAREQATRMATAAGLVALRKRVAEWVPEWDGNRIAGRLTE